MLSDVLVGVTFVPVEQIDKRFGEVDDWDLLRELHRHADGFDGLITSDANMLKLAKEMTVLSQTNLTLVVVDGHGDNMVRATGALLMFLDHVCHHTVRTRAQVWQLVVKQRQPREPRDFLDDIAKRVGRSVESIVAEHKLKATELRRDD